MTPRAGYRVSKSRAGDAPVLRAPRRSARGQAASAWRAMLARLGVRPVTVVEGVRYRAGSSMPLERARAPGGPGILTYGVTFPPVVGGTGPAMVPRPMRIRATRERVYADLMPCRREALYRRISARVRPGSRVLEIGCGTGGGTRELRRLVGPSGAVLATGEDHESIRFARRRYAAPHVGFELASNPRRVPGEPDGSFDALLAIDQTSGFRDTRAHGAIGELWRLVGPGGWLLLSEEDPGSSKLDPMADPDTRDALALVRSACPGASDIEAVSGKREITIIATKAPGAHQHEPAAGRTPG